LKWYILSFILCCFLLIGFVYKNEFKHKQFDIISIDEKQQGVHVFGKMNASNIKPIIQNNFNWITLVPWGHQKDFDSPEVGYIRGDSLAMAQRDSMWTNQIDLAHSNDFKVFLKPHVWLTDPSDGKWRSEIYPSDETNWKTWQETYREFILYYAKIAEKNNVEMFCIGTEFTKLTFEKPDFWKSLIQDVRKIYAGKITYAANWYKEFEKITFWGELDYIGIQAYFPLVKNEFPTVQQIEKGWDKYFSNLKSIYKKYHRNIIFTELGYKSTADSAIDPWTWIDYTSDQNKTLSTQTQANCYEAFFNSVWKKKWLAGVHIWQWRSDYKKERGKNHLEFTPQGKPAEKVITKGFESKSEK